MSVQRLHPLEKTSVQLRHTIKRLEVFVDITKDEKEKALAENLLNGFKELKRMIPKEYQDVDIKG